MPRPQRCRRVCEEPEYNSFSPDGIPNNTCITLTVDEYEVIRLVDLEQLNHAQAAEKMNISRPTATEIYNTARTKATPNNPNQKQVYSQNRIPVPYYVRKAHFIKPTSFSCQPDKDSPMRI